MEEIITTLNQHWPIFTALIAMATSAVTWVISQNFANKGQDKNIADLTDGCERFNKRICVLEGKDVEFIKYQNYAKSNRERIEILEQTDKSRAENLGSINVKLSAIEMDCKWLRQVLTKDTELWNRQQ